MSITRTAWTDSDGTPGSGTILNNAEKTALYDQIDARWSRFTYTLTGGQNNVDVDEADLVLLNSASDSTLTGLQAPASPAKPGKVTIFKNIHATTIFTFAHNNGSSSAGNKFFNAATVAGTSVSTGGWAAYQYDDVNGRWNLCGHQQGAWIAFTPTWAASGTQPAIGNGSLSGRYRLSGRTVSFEITVTMGSTTTFGTGTYTLTFPLTAAATVAACGPLFMNDAGASQYVGIWRRVSTTTFDLFNSGSPAATIGQTVPVTWATSDTWQVSGTYEVA